MSQTVNAESMNLLGGVLEEIYRQAYLDISAHAQAPLPPTTRGLLGDPDEFLRRAIPKLEDERERRRQVGARIKAARKQAGYTQAAVAKKLGIAPQSVTNYESGKTEPTIRNLISLSAVFGVSTDWLLGRSVH